MTDVPRPPCGLWRRCCCSRADDGHCWYCGHPEAAHDAPKEVTEVIPYGDIPVSSPDGDIPGDTPSFAPELGIYRADNGWLLRSEEYGTEVVEGIDEPWKLMWAIAEALGVLGSRHDAKRLTIGYAPGDRYIESPEGI